MSSLSAELVERYRAGDDEAATILFERYVEQLTRLARTRLSLKLAKRTDPDDIVMSAYRSFFLRTREGRFQFERSGDLWALLVQITLHKIARSATRHHAERRSIDKESPLDATIPAVAADPTAEDVVAFNEELESLMSVLEPATRRVLELRLQGNSQQEIAQLLDISDRTVRRRMDEIRTAISGRLSRFGVIVQKEVPESTTVDESHTPQIQRTNIAPLDLSDRVTVSDLDYSIERFLGGGGFGRVFFARSKQDGQSFALKFLRKQFLASPRAVRALIDESEFVARLSHPGIVQVRDVGRTARGHLFLVMDYVDGKSLREYAEIGTRSLVKILQLAQRIVEILSAVHNAGIIHCDLKPDNVLIDRTGKVYLTDFGLARRAAESEREFYPPAGTVTYMAPEQLESVFGSISPSTDLYSLGMILFELLTGRTLFQNGSLPDLIGEIIAPRAPEFVANLLPTMVPCELVRLIESCLSRVPDVRPANAEEVLNKINSILVTVAK